MGPNCPHCGAELGNIFVVHDPLECRGVGELTFSDDDEDDLDGEELVDDDGPGPE